MAKVIVHVTIYTGTIQINDGFIRFDEKIIDVGEMNAFVQQNTDQVIEDYSNQTIIPGFIDVHVHGGYGVDTMDADFKTLDNMVLRMAKNEGVTSVFPTTITQSVDAIDAALSNVAQVAKTNRLIQGVHLEGPFINKIYKGAQPEEFIIPADTKLMKHWIEISNHLIKLVTYAPENADGEFENYLISENIVPSIGHTDASQEVLKKTMASHGTHLFNAQKKLNNHEENVTGYILLDDNITGELISDGFHVVPQMLELAYRLKGKNKIELITDAMRAKGLGDGQSELGGQKVIVKDKQARLENGSLAGSVLTFDQAFINIQKYTSADLQAAVEMSSVNQAKEFHLSSKGELEKGRDADFNVIGSDLNIIATFSFGSITK